MQKIIIVIGMICLLPAYLAAQSNSASILKNVRIIDVENGSISKKSAVKISAGYIEKIGTFRDLKTPGATVWNGKGRYLIPGLWDNHIHIEGENLVEDNLALFQVYLAHGITTVRDAASDLGEQVLMWRDDINQHKLVGPTIYTAGRKLEGINSIWKGDLEIADLLLLDQNPLQDIQAVSSLSAVIKGGILYDRKALDDMLQQAADKKAALDRSRGDEK